MIEIEIGRRSINVHFCPNIPTLVSKLFPLGDPQKEWKHVILGVSHSLQHCFDYFRECSPWKCIPISLCHTQTHPHTHSHAFPYSPSQSVSLSLTHTLTLKGLRVPDEFSHSSLFISICAAIFSHVCFDSMQMIFLHLSDPFASRKNILTS